MTILFFARRFYPQIGGVEKHVMAISRLLIAKGHRVIVVTEEPEKPPLTPPYQGENLLAPSLIREGWGGFSSAEIVNAIQIIRIPVGKEDKFKKFRIWKSLWRLRGLIRQADVIHCHDVFFWYLPFRLLHPRKPVYTTFHGYESFPVNRKAIVIRKISEKLSTGNICIGDFIKKWYGTNPTYVSYGGVESSSHQVIKSSSKEPLAPRPHNLAPQRRESALFFGRLDQQTGILQYVKAYELLKKKYPKFELLVVGDGEYKKQIEKKVKVLGFQENPEKYFEKYRFAFVSGYLSILEAMAAKRLVFSIYESPLKEDYFRMAPFAPFIIIENNPQVLAKKVEYLLNHPEKEQKLVDKAYEWVKKQSWEEMVRVYLRLWNC